MTGARIQIQSVKKRGYLRQLCQGAVNTGLPILTTLQNAQTAAFSPTFQKGRIVVHQSGSGQSGSFEVRSAGAEWTQDNIFGLIEEFIDLYYTVIAQGNDDGTPLPNDDGTPANTNTIFQAMRTDDSLAGVTSQLGDWTGLNVPSLGGVPNAG